MHYASLPCISLLALVLRYICTCICTGYEAIKLRASSEAEMMTWVTSIEDSIKRINNSVSMYM